MIKLKKKIAVGIITNILAYIPVFFLIELFKRTSSRKSKLKKLQKLISSLSGTTKNINLLSESEKVPLKKRIKFIKFPWWFKIILYIISFILMALSILLVVFRGKYFFIEVFSLFLLYNLKKRN
jgi:hypothetical protein